MEESTNLDGWDVRSLPYKASAARLEIRSELHLGARAEPQVLRNPGFPSSTTSARAGQPAPRSQHRTDDSFNQLTFIYRIITANQGLDPSTTFIPRMYDYV
ncbi:hypothetical protein Bbelb_014430 [Branchiostoma belcheri]|nr:hypothetical protein Bbelb_014430 [Branchiostoma belcheri]